MADSIFAMIALCVAVCPFIWLLGCIIPLIIGWTGIENANEIESTITMESCYILNRTQTQCYYDCNCTQNLDGDGEVCLTCTGLEYDYDAWAYDKVLLFEVIGSS